MKREKDQRSLKEQAAEHTAKSKGLVSKGLEQVGERLKEIPKEMGNALDASIRQGASELGNAIVPAFPDSMRPVEVAGGVGNPTQAELSMAKGIYGYGREDAKEHGIHGPQTEKAHELDHQPDYEP